MKLHSLSATIKSFQQFRPTLTRPLISQYSPPLYYNLCRSYADHVMVKVPQMADSISEGTLKTWHKSRRFRSSDEEVATIETDKIDVAVNSPNSGVILELYCKEEDTVTVAGELFKLELKSVDDAPPAQESSSPAPSTSEKTPVPAPPAPVHVSSPPAAAKPPQPKPAQAPKPAPTTSKGRIEEREKLSRMRLRISDRLKESQNTLASLTTFNEVDMTNVMEFRKKYKDEILKEQGIKFGFMSMFAKAVCYGIKHVPVINARIEGGDAVYPNFVDISVAVSTPKGLVTPVLRNTESMSLLGIETALNDLALKARNNQLAIEDMAGGTFTISNGGVFGSMFGTPIINMPQSAILGMHAVKERAVVVNGQVVVRPIMYICLTYDHRLIDGRDAVTFLVKVKQAIEDPRCLLF